MSEVPDDDYSMYLNAVATAIESKPTSSRVILIVVDLFIALCLEVVVDGSNEGVAMFDG